MVSKNVIRESSCSGESLFVACISSICFSVRDTGCVPLSIKNCDSEIPNASQIRSNDEIEGVTCLRYQDEIVDCVIPASSAS